jgi:hypothetical protein
VFLCGTQGTFLLLFRQLAECELRDMEIKDSVAEQEFVAK